MNTIFVVSINDYPNSAFISRQAAQTFIDGTIQSIQEFDGLVPDFLIHELEVNS